MLEQAELVHRGRTVRRAQSAAAALAGMRTERRRAGTARDATIRDGTQGIKCNAGANPRTPKPLKTPKAPAVRDA